MEVYSSTHSLCLLTTLVWTVGIAEDIRSLRSSNQKLDSIAPIYILEKGCFAQQILSPVCLLCITMKYDSTESVQWKRWISPVLHRFDCLQTRKMVSQNLHICPGNIQLLTFGINASELPGLYYDRVRNEIQHGTATSSGGFKAK